MSFAYARESSEASDFLVQCVTAPALAKRWGTGLSTVYTAMRNGLPSHRLGRRRLFHIPTADAWLKGRLTGEGSASTDACRT